MVQYDLFLLEIGRIQHSFMFLIIGVFFKAVILRGTPLLLQLFKYHILILGTIISEWLLELFQYLSVNNECDVSN